MKRKILILAAIAIALSLTSYATIAYFTTQGTASNVITAGNVVLKLHEESANGVAAPHNGLNGLMPGDSAEKTVFVENVGDNAFYTRIKLHKTVRPGAGIIYELSPDKIHLNIDTENWKLGADGWYYYQSALGKSGRTQPLFTSVLFEAGMGNDYMNAVVNINVIVQAVQSANNGDTVWQASGWPSA